MCRAEHNLAYSSIEKGDFSTNLLAKGCSIYVWREFESLPGYVKFPKGITTIKVMRLVLYAKFIRSQTQDRFM
jgi:hypothetical protein